MSFSAYNLAPALMRGIDHLGFTEPTPIQRSAIPPALEGRDVLACAMTGSGKTAAFVLPILQRLGAESRPGIRALVVTPTRELAAQVHEHFVDLGRHLPITSVAVFGGVKPAPQERALRAGVDVVVATPGRLLDHLQHPWCSMEHLEVLVLDEADRMLDMGFLPDVKRLLAQLPRRRQNLLFSATMPAPIAQLSRSILNDPVRLNIERQAAPATGVRQSLWPVPEGLKPALLLELLQREEVGTALVFTRTKHRANRLTEHLAEAGISCERIHGNRRQLRREEALANFKSGRLRVLVATDIAARGIDIEALPHVVNFDVPVQPDDYIHRVGRTARVQATGDAFTFAAPDEERELAAIERAIGKKIPRRRLEGFDYNARPKGRLEIPIGERIAAIRARKAEERARSRAKAERRAEHQVSRPASSRPQSSRAISAGQPAERPAAPGRHRRRYRSRGGRGTQGQ